MVKVTSVLAALLVASVAAEGKVGRIRSENGRRNLARGGQGVGQGQGPAAKASKNSKVRHTVYIEYV